MVLQKIFLNFFKIPPFIPCVEDKLLVLGRTLLAAFNNFNGELLFWRPIPSNLFDDLPFGIEVASNQTKPHHYFFFCQFCFFSFSVSLLWTKIKKRNKKIGSNATDKICQGGMINFSIKKRRGKLPRLIYILSMYFFNVHWFE